MSMKRIAIYFLATLLVAACETNPSVQESKDLNLNLKSLELLASDNLFGLELFQEVMQGAKDDENVMISPLSVALALGMTYNGSASTTREAMEATLKLQGLTEDEINDGYKSIIDQLLDLDPKVVMEIANSIWYKEGFEVEDEFIKTNKDHFYAEIRSLDFSSPDAVNIINQWVSDNTNGLIEEIIDAIPPAAVMYLINAIYFKGTWTYEFDPDETNLEPFSPEAGGSSETPAMHQETKLNYYQNSLFELVELPYGDKKFSMLVFLPSADNTCSDILAEMDNDNWNNWTNNFSETKIYLQLPKFKFETFKLLNDPLSSMGMEIAFSDAADFTRINPAGNLFISRVLHKTFIDVNEEGTEAAAVTAVEISLTSAGGSGLTHFIADKPFLFVIRENSTGSILFMGRMSQPEY